MKYILVVLLILLITACAVTVAAEQADEGPACYFGLPLDDERVTVKEGEPPHNAIEVDCEQVAQAKEQASACVADGGNPVRAVDTDGNMTVTCGAKPAPKIEPG